MFQHELSIEQFFCKSKKHHIVICESHHEKICDSHKFIIKIIDVVYFLFVF